MEAANKEVADAEIVIVAEHFGDLLGRSDQRGGVAVGPREFCDLRPETLVYAGALPGQRQQPPRARGRMTVRRFAIAGLVLQRCCPRQNLLGLCPGLFLGVGENWANRQTKSRGRSAVFRRSRSNPRRYI